MKEYVYGGSLAILALPYLILFLALKKQRILILAGSFLALPQSFYSFIVVPEYWNPKRIIGTRIGAEDFLFSFLAGGIAWTVFAGLLRRKIDLRFRPATALSRFFLSVLFAFFIGFPLSFLGLKKMEAIFLLMMLWAVFLLCFKMKFSLFYLRGVALFILVYVLWFKLTLVFFPGFSSFWTSSNLWGITLLNIPLEEIIWAGLFSTVWPMTVVYILEPDRNETLDGIVKIKKQMPQHTEAFIRTEPL
ncbi:MAG: hypothetical protein JXB26_01705 [Candidatus Aminicenantes bacterium]|nr:hypothetical protein [Candidatus Aminicenantes bacterium]